MIFIDTGAFLARHLSRDQYHKQAVKRWDKLAADRALICTSNFVIDELLTLLSRRTNADYTLGVADTLYRSRSLEIFRPNEEIEKEALSLLKKFDDQGPSFTDCVSFILMKKYQVKKAFTYDRHFDLAGFSILR